MLYLLISAVIFAAVTLQALGLTFRAGSQPMHWPAWIGVGIPVLGVVVAARSRGWERVAAAALCGVTLLTLNWPDWSIGSGAPVVLMLTLCMGLAGLMKWRRDARKA